MSKSRSKRRRSFTIRAALTRLLLIAALPVWLAMAILLYKLQVDARASIERDASATARALMMAIDRDLTSAQTAAAVLSASSALSAGDLRAFYSQAVAALQENAGADVLLIDRSGREILNALVPYGEPLPAADDTSALRAVFETGKPTTSDLPIDTVHHHPVISIYQPVSVDNMVVYALVVALKPDRLNEILRQEQLPAGWVASILDSQRAIVAGTYANQSPGEKAGENFQLKTESRNTDVGKARVPESTQVAGVFARSAISGWTVVISVPSLALATQLWKSVGISFGSTIVLVVLGFVGARVQARRLARPIQALEELATAYGRGDEIDPPPLRLREADDVARALADGSRQLRFRTRERDRAYKHRRRIVIANKLIAKQARARSAYFAYLGHELGSPLMAIRAFAEAIGKSVQETSVAAKCLDYCTRIDTTTSHLIGIVDQILDYAKFEAHEIDLHIETLEITEEIDEVIKMLERNAAQAGISVQCQTASSPSLIYADRMRFRQILLNILSNALKFTPAGGTVKIIAGTDGDETVICVMDTGIGISPKDLTRVLQPFMRAKNVNAKQHAGSGLGLPLSKGLVDLHGGTFKLESTLDVGTTVTLRFPLPECTGEMLAESCSMRIS